jgi:TolB-like protein
MNRSTVRGILFAALCTGAILPNAQAQAPTSSPTTVAQAPANNPGITVALLDFDANMPGNADLGKQITEALTAVLTGESGFTLVDRASVNRTLQEHELNLTGLVNSEQATQIGKLVGAKILVSGKAFLLDKKIYVTAKIIGTETGLVEGILVNGPKDADTGSLVMDLSTKLSDRLRTNGPKLVAAQNAAPDPLIALQTRLKGKTMPKVGVLFKENHVPTSRPAAHTNDPAVETEFKSMLTDAGFTVIEGDEKDWTREGVEVVITGNAFSEAATKIGNIVSCSGRVEVNVVNVKNNHLLLAARTTSRAADLSEQIAAKTALQKASHALGIQVLEYFDKQQSGATTAPAK